MLGAIIGLVASSQLQCISNVGNLGNVGNVGNGLPSHQLSIRPIASVVVPPDEIVQRVEL